LKEDPLLAQARIQLVQATRQVLFNVLTGILGLSAPESM
jgi:arginyl-tRNA synthetase